MGLKTLWGGGGDGGRRAGGGWCRMQAGRCPRKLDEPVRDAEIVSLRKEDRVDSATLPGFVARTSLK